MNFKYVIARLLLVAAVPTSCDSAVVGSWVFGFVVTTIVVGLVVALKKRSNKGLDRNR